ncbi:uncharacterized protein LOC127665935 [Apodemus sylvaticus]|uniref:uncharacterized protein LOC127665935 n=1 Tax=Apodemus sylvaticus TaxID=10129 RepID=UPI00224390D1|nr:uncharacterized protein LOC127665935 [Apodemus sylvaticus]
MWRRIMMLWWLTHLTIASESYFWSFSHTWPIPVPVHNESNVFPQFYSTRCHYGVPCKSKDQSELKVQSFNQTRVPLAGTLCFSNSFQSQCIQIQNQTLAAFDDPLRYLRPGLPVEMLTEALIKVSAGQQSGSGDGSNDLDTVNTHTFWMNMTLLIPMISKDNSSRIYNGSKPTYLCPNVLPDYPPEFLHCRGQFDRVFPISPGFWFTIDLDRYKYRNNSTKKGWPLSTWTLINSKGAVCDLSPIVNLENSKVDLFNVSGVLNSTTNRLVVNSLHKQHNMTFSRGRMCVDPPFLFLLFNYSSPVVDCKNQSCYISQCWGNRKYDSALVMRMPTLVPIPVRVDPSEFPLVTLFRQKRDFGITAAIVTAIAVSAAAAVTAGVAMANQVQTVTQINEIVQKTSTALSSQEKMNAHFASGILMLNKRIDLLEVALQDLFDVISTSCVDRTPHICVTPYSATLNESKQLSNILSGNWSREFEQLQANFSYHIHVLNSTKVELVTIGQFSDWMVKTFSYFKEWIGVGMFGAFCLAGLFLTLFLFCKL